MHPVQPLFAALFLQWTLLLALGWVLHALIRHQHPRWRLILWRSVLVFSVALPLVLQLHLPRLDVPAPRLPVSAIPFAIPRVTVPSEFVPQENLRGATSDTIAEARNAAPASTFTPQALGRSWSWAEGLLAVWLAGLVWSVGRLLHLHYSLRQLRRAAHPASAPIRAAAERLQTEMHVRRRVAVLVSDYVASPCLCGVLRPVILIPRRLADEITPAELDALLSHELAHQVRHDLIWCIAWRWARAVGWCHPLVWNIPAAHVLACEEEADRIAASRTEKSDTYAQLLAQLALRILRGSAPENALALSATSHLARRLLRLGRDRVAAWGNWHSLAGFAAAGTLLVLTAGWQFAQVPATKLTPPPETVAANVPTAMVLVTVHDENGKPVVGATLTPSGLRAKGSKLRTTGYGWRPSVHGAAQQRMTDGQGQAVLTYPIAIVPEEKVLTGEISFLVKHPEFTSARPSVAVEATPAPIKLERGIPLRVAGFFGAQREPVPEILAILIGPARTAEPVRNEDWLRGADGSLSCNRLGVGKHFLQVSGRLASGEMVYSDGFAFFGEQSNAHDYRLELKPGIRVEGRLDSKVHRPVKNGWVELSVHHDEANTDEMTPRLFTVRSGSTGFWFTYRPIAADGSFVFESVPRGEVIKVVAHGDGFISANGVEAPRQPPHLSRPTPARRATRSVPHSTDAVLPVTKIEVATEATATVRVVAKAGGKPVSGATVHIWPNVIQMPTGSRGFATSRTSSEAPFHSIAPMPEPAYAATTDAAGVAVLGNVPAFVTSFSVRHDELESALEVPSGNLPANRYIKLDLTPGQLSHVEVALQPKGNEFIGTTP